MRALRAVAAILRTAPGLDTEQARGFDVIGIAVRPVNALGAEHQIGERHGVKRFGFRAIPVVPNERHSAAPAFFRCHSMSHSICSPLNTIIGNTLWLNHGEKDAGIEIL